MLTASRYFESTTKTTPELIVFLFVVKCTPGGCGIGLFSTHVQICSLPQQLSCTLPMRMIQMLAKMEEADIYIFCFRD